MLKKIHKTNSGKFAMMIVIKANPLSKSSIMYLYFSIVGRNSKVAMVHVLCIQSVTCKRYTNNSK